MKKKLWGSCLVLLLFAGLLAGCGGGTSYNEAGHITYTPDANGEEETEFQLDRDADLYVLEIFDQTSETIQVYRISNGIEYQFHFDLDTDFLDKYEDITPSSNFVPGKIVELKVDPSDNMLLRVRLSDEVWEYTDITNFSVDQERGIFYIAEDKYNYDENTFVFSGDQLENMSDLTEKDELTVYGIDKKILAVLVTTGHGNLQLMNTTLFEGSFLQLGTKIFSIITPNMNMEVQEGTYTLSVANDGWGGTCTVVIERGLTTEVDLDQIKGEGPKYGNILFEVDVEGATIEIDGQSVDYSIPISLRYGWHTLTVTADGYDDWSKKLYVNSEEATIEITLEETSTSTTTTTDTDTDTSTDTTTDTDTGTSTTTDTSDDYLSDYLSTLTDLIGSF